MPFFVALDAAAPGLIFVFGVLPVLLRIAVAAVAVYLIVRAVKKKKK